MSTGYFGRFSLKTFGDFGHTHVNNLLSIVGFIGILYLK